MFLSENCSKALCFADEAHSGQMRDFSGEPYIEHPKRVAEIVSEAGMDDEHIIIALLHDTIEDTDVTSEQIHKQFGTTVGVGVDYLTEPAKARGDANSMPKEKRKAEFLRQLETAPKDIKAIKLCDILDNTRDMSLYYKKNTVRAEKFYFAKMDMLTRLIKSDPVLFEKAAKALDTLRIQLI